LIAAKSDARSGSICPPAPYSVFTSVNGNEIMNTYATIIAGTEATPVIPGIAYRAHAGTTRHVPDRMSSGVRDAGQYCRSPVQPGTEPTMTALRMNHGMMAVSGMCP
jgi:hypothetical protein